MDIICHVMHRFHRSVIPTVWSCSIIGLTYSTYVCALVVLYCSDEDVATVTALLSIKETLPLIFNTCTAVEACDTLSRFYPAKMKEPLLSIVLGILIPSGFISVVLIVLLAVVYHRHRRRKVHLQLGQ